MVCLRAECPRAACTVEGRAARQLALTLVATQQRRWAVCTCTAPDNLRPVAAQCHGAEQGLRAATPRLARAAGPARGGARGWRGVSREAEGPVEWRAGDADLDQVGLDVRGTRPAPDLGAPKGTVVDPTSGALVHIAKLLRHSTVVH